MTFQQNNLTWEQEKAIMDYKNHYGFTINRKLRNGEELSDWDQEKIKDLDKALAKMPYYQHSIIRCVDLVDKPNEFKIFMDQHQEGNLVKYEAYTSFSTDFEKLFNEDANIRVVILKPEKVRDIRLVGENEEKELLYERNSSFRIISNKFWKKKYWITMEEV